MNDFVKRLRTVCNGIYRIELSQYHMDAIVRHVFYEVAARLNRDGEIAFRDFGKFSTKVRPARTARNPRTGEPVDVPEKVVVKFKAFTDLKRSLNQ